MELNTATSALLSELDTLSGGTITRRPDLGILLEIGRIPSMREVLDELSFYSKFLRRTRGLMARIGRAAEGYDKLEKEFTESAARIRALLTSLAAASPDDVRERLTATYLAMTAEGFENLLALCHDLSWYKNWLIDNRTKRKEGT